ncbi:MAG: diguanylate cyclase [Rhodocyclaceae bacterium]|nr:diguanylate cyclase [Rhodocyclaceae bacterium]MDZ4214918.1 diguanylate cyclase [Rhodocyclaceae bacterium]
MSTMPSTAPTPPHLTHRLVGEFMQADVLTCAPDVPLVEAAARMRAVGCGSIVILAADGEPAGIWTEHDAAHLDLADPTRLDQPIGGAMSTPVRTIGEQTEAGEAILLMREHHLRHLLVVDAAGRLRGIVSRTDLTLRYGVGPFLRLRAVGEVLGGGFLTIPGELPLAEAARRMAERGCDAAIVDCPDCSPGILTERDVLRMIATRDLLATSCSVASHPLQTIGADHSLLEARQMLIDSHIRHLGVTGGNGALIGLLSLNEILELIEHDYTAELMAALRQRDEEQRIAAIAFERTTPMMLCAADGRILRVNPAFCAMTGYGPAELVGQRPSILKSGRHAPAFYAALWQTLLDNGHWCGEIWNRRKNGEIYPEWLAINAVKDDRGRVTHYVASLEDLTAKIEAQNRLRLAASVFEHAREGIMVTDRKRIIVEVNAAFTAITGYSRDEAIGKTPAILRSGLQDADFYTAMNHTLDSAGHWQGEVWNRRKEGEVYAELLNISAVPGADGEPMYFVGLFSDITPQKERESRLETLAHYDVLTGLPNRRLLDDRLNVALAQHRRRHEGLAVCLLDLDAFKPVNDTYGHAAGDRLLRTLAERILTTVREEDTVARLGGDEFVILLAGLDTRPACEEILQRMLAAVARPVAIDGAEVCVGCSIGATWLAGDAAELPEAARLFDQADSALYAAKRAGKGCAVFYSDKGNT